MHPKDTTVTIKDVNIDVSGSYNAAMEVQGAGDTTLKLEGNNTLKSGEGYAGLEKDDSLYHSPYHSTGKLTITAEDANASFEGAGW